MGWRIIKHTWPNGREYWTIEDRKNRRIRVGQNGGLTKYYDKAAASIEAERLRSEDKEARNG